MLTRKSSRATTSASPYRMKPLSQRTWKDFENLFGTNGACGGCWCMWWRLEHTHYLEQRGAKNKNAMRTIIRRGGVPGIILYDGREPFGWCSIARREEYPKLEKSRVLARVDAKAVWSIVCFFIRRDYRRKGLLEELIRQAVSYARDKGARFIEAYPYDVKNTSAAFIYTGVPAPFAKAGFVEVLRRSKTRPIMRYRVR